MANSYVIDIDGFIGEWTSSKYWIKQQLSKNQGKSVAVRVNSLGGLVDDAIDIAAQFEAHGNITVDLFSFNASAATILTLGAAKVRAHSNSLYLIHKALSWVNEWGYMNEDEIAKAIESLKSEQKRNEAITLTIAKMYSKRTGKTLDEIYRLMKEEKWLTAEEAKAAGFVDEIFEDAAIKPVNIHEGKMAALFDAAQLPRPAANNVSLNNISMKRIFTSVNELLQVEGIEFSEGKCTLTEEQMRVINLALAAEDAGVEEQKEDTKKASAAPATPAAAPVDSLDATISALTTRIAALEAGPGATTGQANAATDGGEQEIADADVDFGKCRALFNLLP
jgi:ATP-dependent protease ClpP protease subunit